SPSSTKWPPRSRASRSPIRLRSCRERVDFSAAGPASIRDRRAVQRSCCSEKEVEIEVHATTETTHRRALKIVLDDRSAPGDLSTHAERPPKQDPCFHHAADSIRESCLR